ncbi:N-acetylglucosamine kinase [Rhodopseudomonas palustris HaA2]|uniref:N-acetylglucosamine kinase n=1 Tax=Rhodopseudomonas palustris (strain HaA2) TaxID=316058 RepID=Q2IYD7_RHOP2|nr:ROK family protein [Rhodopseudomonas palustris]ABD06773.1 N-acetylglucosamine kinase [Rhodopseudomonas palustris HaA2]
MSAIFAVDLGATWLRTARVAPDGRWIDRKARVPTPDGPAEARKLIETAWRRAGCAEAVALATAPELDSDGVVRRWPNRRDYEGAPLLTDALRCVARLALFDDATAAALSADDVDGAADAITLCLSIGSGIGGGVVIAGRPLVGAHHAAMDAGHMPVPSAAGLRCACGRDGCLQAVASGGALQRHGGGALFGDARAEPALHRATAALAEALAILQALFDPERVVIAGGLGLSPLFDRIAAELKRSGVALAIAPHHHGDDAALVGAAIGLARGLAPRASTSAAISPPAARGDPRCKVSSPNGYQPGRVSTTRTSGA